MKPLSNYYTGAVNGWMRDHPYSTIGLKDIYALCTVAYLKASTMETAINGFRKTGIQPFNPEDFVTRVLLQTASRVDLNEKGIIFC